jgi:hypothetical protein
LSVGKGLRNSHFFGVKKTFNLKEGNLRLCGM